MKIKLAPLIALSLSLAGCSTLEKAIINSEIGRQAVYNVQYKFMNSFKEKCRIEDFGLSQKDNYSDKPILFFIYGWGGNLDELLNEGKKEGFSKFDVMREVFENRVIIADYPSNLGIESIFSDLENSFISFEKKYSENNFGKKPKIILAGHSMGSQIARLFARKYRSYIEKVGLIAGLNEGLNLGILTTFVRDEFPKYMEEILLNNKKKFEKEDCQSITDILAGSRFMRSINTPTPQLNLEYDFYAFDSQKDNWIIPGEDDGVTSLNSAYPVQLIKRKKFENVDVKTVMIFKGDVDHLSINNMNVLRMIMESLKSENRYFSVSEIIIPKCPPNEEKIREYEKNLKKKIKRF